MKKKIVVITINIFKILLNIVYSFIKLFPIKHQVVMISRQSNNVTLDFQLLKEEMKKHDNKLKVIVLCKKLEKGLINKLIYCIYIFKIMYYLATSKVCILDSYCIPASILKHKKQLKIIQIWHASGAVKKFGYQILNKKEGSNSIIAELMCMHKNYDYIIAPSEQTKKMFSEAFNFDINKIIILGLPRLEYIVNSNFDRNEEIYKEYPFLRNKKNILYIPTFRKNSDINLVKEILKSDIDKDKYNLIIKLHPLDNTYVPDEYIIDTKYNSYDLIKIADYIVTYYSILSIDASVLNKPIFLYLPDLKEYEESRGLNINLKKELPSFICENFVEIIDKIEKKEYNMKELCNYEKKYIEIDIQKTINELVKFIFDVLKEGENNR